MRIITEKIDGTNAAYASAVFVALRWIANDHRQPDGPVETIIGAIAHCAGLSYNKAGEMLNLLEKIGVISIERRKITGTNANAPSVYTFPTIRGTFPTEHPPRRAEIRKEGKESKESIAPGAAAPRREGELFEALAAAEGSEPSQLTEPAKRAIDKALNEIRAVCPSLTPGEINRRAANYRKRMPKMILTASALVRHWAACDKTVIVGSRCVNDPPLPDNLR
jgi:hypothetical protein